jgi:hypothetical protein
LRQLKTQRADRAYSGDSKISMEIAYLIDLIYT